MTLAKSKTKAYTEAEKKRDVIGKGDAVVIIGAGALPLQLRRARHPRPEKAPRPCGRAPLAPAMRDHVINGL